MCVDVRERWMGRSRFLLCCCSVVPVWGIDYSGTDRRTHRRNSNMSPSLSLSLSFPLFLFKKSKACLFYPQKQQGLFLKIHSHSHWHRIGAQHSRLLHTSWWITGTEGERNEIVFAYFVFFKKKQQTNKKKHIFSSAARQLRLSD